MKTSQGKIASVLLETKYEKTLVSYIEPKFLSLQKYINLHFSFTQNCVNYGNITLGTTRRTNLKKIYAYQKKTVRLSRPFLADCLDHAISLMQDMNGINARQITIYQNLTLLYKPHTISAPSIFCEYFSNKF